MHHGGDLDERLKTIIARLERIAIEFGTSGEKPARVDFVPERT